RGAAVEVRAADESGRALGEDAGAGVVPLEVEVGRGKRLEFDRRDGGVVDVPADAEVLAAVDVGRRLGHAEGPAGAVGGGLGQWGGDRAGTADRELRGRRVFFEPVGPGAAVEAEDPRRRIAGKAGREGEEEARVADRVAGREEDAAAGPDPL